MVHLASKELVVDLILNYSSLLFTDPVYFWTYAVIPIHNQKLWRQFLLETETRLVVETTLTEH